MVFSGMYCPSIYPESWSVEVVYLPSSCSLRVGPLSIHATDQQLAELLATIERHLKRAKATPVMVEEALAGR